MTPLTVEVPGLLLADDTVLMAETQEELTEALDKYTVWCDKWRMEVGAKKRGVMCLHDPSAHEQLKGATWKLQGQSIPVVDQYKYLGMQIGCSISIRAMVGGRQTIGNPRLAAMGPFCQTEGYHAKLKPKLSALFCCLDLRMDRQHMDLRKSILMQN